MTEPCAPQVPPFCPNPACPSHLNPATRRVLARDGFYARGAGGGRVQRYRCSHCRRRCSQQTFRTSYWLRRPELLEPVFHRLLGCSAYRQIAREFGVSPSTVMRHAARLGRHCLLVHERLRPRGPLSEPLVVDGFVSFEYSQDHPTSYHVAVGAHSHYLYGFTDSELRRSGQMTERQRWRRARVEARFGRPDPRSTELEVAALLALVAPVAQSLELESDDHRAYPRALRRAAHLRIRHRVTSSRRARTARNPLFPVNLLDLLIRHSGANHKRETIAFSKRRQSAIERLAVLMVWRNYVKAFSERRHDASPAMRLGLLERRWQVAELLAERQFPWRVRLPERWARYYWRNVRTRRYVRQHEHRCRYAL